MSIRTLINALGDALSPLGRALTDASLPEGEREATTDELCGSDPRGRAAQCEADRRLGDELGADVAGGQQLVIVDMQDKAAKAFYRKGPLAGRPKRIAMGTADLARRRVVITLHQTGEETDEQWPSYHRITSHFVISPMARVLRLHPLQTVLMQTNRFNRAPWHQIGIEVSGCFEALDGSGRWPPSALRGHGRASDRQIEATVQLVTRLVHVEVPELGGVVEAIVPHIVAGRDETGKPNRQACPSSRVWSEAGERAAAELGIAVPGPAFSLGGVPIPEEWHGPYWSRCIRRL